VWEFQTPEGSLAMAWWEEYIATSGVQEAAAGLQEAELVFVGYGIQAPEYHWDDYHGMDLTGKVLLMLNNDPDWDPELFEGERRLYYGRWTYKYESAAAQGAAGAIIIHTTPSAGYGWQVVQNSWTGPQFQLPAEGEARLQVEGWLTEDAAARLVAGVDLDLQELVESARGQDFVPVPLGITTSLTLNNRIETVTTANVLGLLPGGDPERADEVVVYTAHHDHIGIGPPDEDGDTIYNGARDNAAGVAQIVSIAKAFAALKEPPRRSILFLAVGAEEQGLLGSKYYARHPTFPAGKIAANVNYDAPGIWGRTRDVQLVGMGKSDVDEVARRMATFQGREVVPEKDPTTGSYYRSDQFAFAKIGVPALYFGSGSEYIDPPEGFSMEAVEAWGRDHYHQQSDEYDPSWNLEGAAENARLGFYCGWALAQDDGLPGWKPGDEFEATRKAALAAVE
jgi:Zn-dependent M28 family amino/carboxypeptidase